MNNISKSIDINIQQFIVGRYNNKKVTRSNMDILIKVKKLHEFIENTYIFNISMLEFMYNSGAYIEEVRNIKRILDVQVEYINFLKKLQNSIKTYEINKSMENCFNDFLLKTKEKIQRGNNINLEVYQQFGIYRAVELLENSSNTTILLNIEQFKEDNKDKDLISLGKEYNKELKKSCA